MDFFRDDRECLKPDIKNTIDKCNIKIEEEDDGFEKAELKWTDERFEDSILGQ